MFELSDWNEDGSIILSEHDGDIFIELHENNEDESESGYSVRLQFTADQAREIYDRLGHMLYGLTYKD